MKNFITKIISSAILATFLIVPTVSFAATFNSASNDLPTLRAGNYTKNPNQDAITWTTSTSADAGDTVNLAVYYHNTGSDTARNVRVHLSPQATGTGTTHTFTVSISSDNAPTVTGSATFSLSSNQSIAFNGNTAWRPNRVTSGTTPFPSGKSGYDLFSSQGVNIGDITPGWGTQGNIFVAFRVSNNTYSGGITGSAPSIATNAATQVSGSSAMLNGYVNGNSLSTNAWFEYGTTTAFGNTTPQYGYGAGAANFNAGLSNLASNTTYYFRAVAQNTQGLVYGSVYSFTTTSFGGSGSAAPIVSTSSASNVTANSATLNGYVNNNGSPVNAWFEYGTTTSFGNTTQSVSYGLISANYGASVSGLLPSTTYYFRAVAQNTQGTVYGNIYSFTTTSTSVTTGGVAPVVTTLLATEIAGDLAKLNGLVFASSGQSSSAWFEWGTTTSLGSKTSVFTVGALPSIKHSDMLTGLSVGQKYYYRVVAENIYGKTYGAIMSFTAGTTGTNTSINTTTRATKTTTTVTRTVSVPVTLTLDGGAETITPKEERAYRVSWKNESTQGLKNVVLRVVFPQAMTVKSTDKGVIASADNTVILDIDTLAKGATSELSVVATASRSLVKDELIVVTANMVYTDTAGVQGDVVAYVTQHGVIEQSQVASIFGAGLLPTTILGWALLLVLLLALILLGNILYGRMIVKTQ